MKLNAVKNFIIAFFVILAVYQTGKLWFEDFSSHNFFYSFSADKNEVFDDGALYSLDSIIVNQGSDKALCLRSGIYKSDYKDVFDKAVKLAAEEGRFGYGSVIDWNTVLTGRAVIYRYNYSLSGKDIANMFGFKESLVSNISGDIDTVIIAVSPSRLDVIFADNKSSFGYNYSLDKNQYIGTVYDTAGSIPESRDIYYTSTVRNGFNIFKNNLFVPQWQGGGFGYNTINMINPFEADGGVLLNRLEKNIDIFFDNPAAKWTSNMNGVYTYSDESTVLKYYTTGVLEYSNYRAGNNNSESSFYDDYTLAVSFLKKDSNIKNEFYLKRYEKNDERTVFYFDYKINNFPVVLSDDIKVSTGLDSIIEITVDGGRVSKYKRYVCDFSVSPDYQAFAVRDFLKAIDEVFADRQSENSGVTFIDNMFLGYAAKEGGDNIYLNWFIEADGINYIKSAGME